MINMGFIAFFNVQHPVARATLISYRHSSLHFPHLNLEQIR